MELLKLGQEYNDVVQKCTKIYEDKIKKMKEEISQLKNQINVYYNKNEYILKKDHEKFLEELKKMNELHNISIEIILKKHFYTIFNSSMKNLFALRISLK